MNLIKQPLPWQARHWSDWMQLLRSRRLPHAVLITGMAGLGKRHLSEALVQAVLCNSADSRPCGACKSCQLLIAGSHPDLRIVEPEDKSKAVKIDQIRGLVRFLSGTSQQGGWKCVIVDPADSMNPYAANALLKSLEEPPGDSLIVLVSSNPGRLLPTLRSRCRLITMDLPSREQALTWLEPRVGERAVDLLDFARGAPLRALSAYESNALEGRAEMLAALLDVAENQGNVVDGAKRVQGADALNALDQLLVLLNRLARGQFTGEVINGAPAGERWNALIQRLDPALLFRYQDKLLQAKHQLLSGANPNVQLLWEELMLDWRALTRVRAIGPATRLSGQ